MRRKLTLYIGDRRADLSDESFVLFNYTQDDLSNPTVVRNSFSQQITLKGTPANNAIFGDYFRLDRVVNPGAGNTGAGFDPSRKVPFSIYDEKAEILAAGYVKLDAVSWRRDKAEYKVTLYGGLGSLLYNLSYTPDGERKTLASLDYLGTGNPDTELDFTINVLAVRTAWDTVQDGVIDYKWKVINFAPAYEGIPANFGADKFLGVPSDFNLPNTQDTHTLNSGYAIFNLPEKADGWKMREFRSYLQRPVLSVRALLDAVAKPGNNGGYTIDLSDIDAIPFRDLWLTLPLLPSLTPGKSAGGLSLDTINSGTGIVDIIGTVPAGVDVTASISCKFSLAMIDAAAQSYATLYSSVRSGGTGVQTVIFAQLLALDSGNNVVGQSSVRSWYDFGLPARDMATACGYTPEGDAAFEQSESLVAWSHSGGGLFAGPEMAFTVTAQYVSAYEIRVTAYRVETQTVGGVESITGVSLASSPRLWADLSTEFQGTKTYAPGTSPDTIAVPTASNIRSGATITKAMLLSTSKTPAEYLLSFCKAFGLYLLVDEAEKTAKVLRRDSLFLDETEDISRRVDVGKPFDITPLAFDAKWYDFDPEVVEGAFAKEYADIYGIPYGIQRVNTGYDFNADATNLMDGTAFRAAVARMARNKYFNVILSNSKYIPSAFLDKGVTYTLWDSAGQTEEYQVSGPPLSASVTYDNPTFPGYDATDKAEFCEGDGKPVDGVDVLLFRDGDTTLPYGALTDDILEMDTLNGGPCWLVGARTSGGVSYPRYSRYKIALGVVTDSLDFGKPKEIGLPGVTYPDSVTVYRRCWANYLADKYAVDTKVLKCRVDFGGWKAGRDLLRRFYWFGGSLWSLNRIINHSMTTFDPTECEFVQVQDKDAYLSGQNL